jgi:LmbE family N-acetylglucosaminyl deacetylase
MKLSLKSAELYIPDGAEESGALARTTHLCVAAHQDDIEIMAYDGIIQCFQQHDRWFTGVVVTNGAGSPRSGIYGKYSDAEMVQIRRKEQKKAAMVGDYAAQFLLDQPSSAIKDPHNGAPVDDLEAILRACRPEVVYTHNLADKHDTHVGVALKLIEAIRRLPAESEGALRL